MSSFIFSVPNQNASHWRNRSIDDFLSEELYGRNVKIGTALTLVCCWLVRRSLSIGSSRLDPEISS
jgi:hypothetical protein